MRRVQILTVVVLALILAVPSITATARDSTVSRSEAKEAGYIWSVTCTAIRDGFSLDNLEGYCYFPAPLRSPARCVETSESWIDGHTFSCKGNSESNATALAQEVMLHSSPESIYSVGVGCLEAEAGFGDVVNGYCDWPFGLQDPAECVPVTSFSGYLFACKSGDEIGDATPVEAIQLSNAPEKIFTVEVTCEDVSGSWGTDELVCDWPMFFSSKPECIEDETAFAFGGRVTLLCKP